MTTNEIVAVDNRPVCQPVTFLIKRLLERGFTVINNGDYQGEDPYRPSDKSLYFVLQSPVKLDTLELNNDAYYLAHFGENAFMCECHYHMVKLFDVVV